MFVTSLSVMICLLVFATWSSWSWNQEAAIHSFHHYLRCHKDNPDLCVIKLDMYNAYNEVK